MGDDFKIPGITAIEFAMGAHGLVWRSGSTEIERVSCQARLLGVKPGWNISTINGVAIHESHEAWNELLKCKKLGRKYSVYFMKDKASILAEQAKMEAERQKKEKEAEERRLREERERKIREDAEKKRQDDLASKKQEYWDKQQGVAAAGGPSGGGGAAGEAEEETPAEGEEASPDAGDAGAPAADEAVEEAPAEEG
mmetsp:Transcript_59932/g.129977  ORF Transcript_59932/g.129977 Transcript_59932/m.129977 type:complete len:197 (-) Transcript_59932:187-777(-)